MVLAKIGASLNPVGAVRVLYRNRALLREMTGRLVVQRYRGSMFGAFWSLAQPLFMLAVYTFVFSLVLRARWGLGQDESPAAFAVVMFCGMAVFNVFSETALSACMIVAGQPNYVKKVVFPLEVLPVAQALATFRLGLPSFALALLGGWAVFGRVPLTALWLPAALVPLLLFAAGAAFFTASLTVYWRDLPHVLGLMLQALFFLTPVVYPASMVPEAFRTVLALNPMAWLVEQTRAVLLFGERPDAVVLGGLWLGSAAAFQLGYGWFIRTKRGFADVL